MALVAAKCTQCGSNIKVDNSKEAGICSHCGTAFITEKAITNLHTNVHASNAFITNNIVYESDKTDGVSNLPQRIIKPGSINKELIFPKPHRKIFIGWLTTVLLALVLGCIFLGCFIASGNTLYMRGWEAFLVLFIVFYGIAAAGIATAVLYFLKNLIPFVKHRDMINLIKNRNCETMSLIEFGNSYYNSNKKKKLIKTLIVILQKGYLINYQLNLDHERLERIDI